jgi:hypothetical protein
MNRDLLNLTVHVFTEHLPNFPLWCVSFSCSPLGYFRARADCPKAAFAAAWDDFARAHVGDVPTWLRAMVQASEPVLTRSTTPPPGQNRETGNLLLLSENFTR